MRRYARTLILIILIVAVSGLSLGFQTVKLGDFERGANNLLGLTLGLDLQGGSHLVYQVTLSDPNTGESIQPTRDQMDGLLSTIERRVNGAGLGEPILQLLGDDRLLIQLPGINDPGRAKRLIGETARLEFKHRILDIERDIQSLTSEEIISFQIGTIIFDETSDENSLPIFRPGTSTEPTELIPSKSPVQQATSTQVSEATSTPVDVTTSPPSDPVIVLEIEPSGATALLEVMDRLKLSIANPGGASTIYPSFLSLAAEGTAEQPLLIPFQPLAPGFGGTFIPLPTDPLITQLADSNKFIVNLGFSMDSVEDALERFTPESKLVFSELIGAMDEDIGLTGEDLARAYPGQHHSTGLPIVNIEFNSEGTRKFSEITSEIAGTPDLLAIILDDEELIAPTVNQPITRGVAFIQGKDFTFDRVSEISLLLEGGRLPVPITLIQERDIDAILGADSLAKSVVAGLVGLILVLAFMITYYRVPGIIASLSLVIYAGMLLTVFKMIPVTLTLSGIAAVILSIGMAVDANILIFERMKEELRSGRTLLSAINIGFNRAWPAIRDGNVSTLITCAILFWFADTLGATIVQGFALTLAIGVLISMFTAITVSRTFLRLMSATAIGHRLTLFVPSGASDLPKEQPVQTG